MKENPRLVPVAAKVPAEHVAELERMADAGDRSVSGEIRRAIREHVAREDAGAPASSRPQPPAERRGPEETEPAVEPRQPVGPEEPA